MNIIIKNGNVVNLNPADAREICSKDLYIKDGIISDTFSPGDDTAIIDASGKYITPGLTDIHVHFRDPGLTHKEDILTGTMAAACGGFTTVCCMPNTVPAIDSVETLKYIDEQEKKADFVDLLPVCAMTKGQAGKELCDFQLLSKTPTLSKELTGHGMCAISEDGITLNDKGLMEEVCKSAKSLDLPIMDHPEPETQIVYRDIELSKKYGCKMHLQHISKKESIELIRQSKTDGINVTAEAAPHHFTLNKNAVNEYGTNAKMNPPLGSERDVAAVIEGLLDDTLDIIATDHAPHTNEEKNITFDKAPNGIIGLETSFPISYTILVKSGLMTLDKLIEKMSSKPLEIINIKSNDIQVGGKANLIIVDLHNEYQIDKEMFHSKGRNTPFHGMDVYGRVETTVYNGKITWNNNGEKI